MLPQNLHQTPNPERDFLSRPEQLAQSPNVYRSAGGVFRCLIHQVRLEAPVLLAEEGIVVLHLPDAACEDA